METWDAINAIRVIRKFTDKPLEPQHLERILNAGRRAASSKNEQTWAFIAVTDRSLLKELTAVGRYADHLAGAAAAIALVGADDNERHTRTVCGTWGVRRRTWSWPPGSWGSAARRRLPTTTRWRPVCSASPRGSAATSSSRSATRPTRRSHRPEQVRRPEVSRGPRPPRPLVTAAERSAGGEAFLLRRLGDKESHPLSRSLVTRAVVPRRAGGDTDGARRRIAGRQVSGRQAARSGISDP